ncbi:PIR Superfamily Protein [Plasmodium ovale curtisi]|uniref:PIR Superfamily Protein n=1 Tax=Plasmodium ovale curtisi TaxID=864141 RepID=A0A1A8X9S6_PLAOA|nr:PIR Superfamily Protein [Plasmodium ovale curtisi]
MTRKVVAGTYTFCIYSNYYEAFVKYVKNKRCDEEKKEICVVGKEGSREEGKEDSCDVRKEKSCDVGTEKSCDELSTSMTFSNNDQAKDICKEFKSLYKSLSEKFVGETTVNDRFSDNDCNFLNYWLNGKLSDNVKDGAINVKDFYEKMKDKDVGFFSKHCNLDKQFYNINPEIFENMKLLYKLYDNAVKVLNIINDPNYKYEKDKSCNDYIEECDEKYKKAMDRCFNSNDDFYNALIIFKDTYQFLTKPSTDKSNTCEYSKFNIFPKYDPVLERKQRNIMAGKILSAPLILLFVIPLLYKYTPFGPFLRTKINMVRGRWINQDKNENELLSLSTDIEDNIFDNGEYNIGYYSETN